MSTTIPTIHLNGTSKRALLDGFSAAHAALRDALEALASAAPNARDYYPQGSDAFTAAAREHEQRMASLQQMRADYQAKVDAIYFL